MPTPEAAEAADRGDLVLAGCVVSSDDPPERRCRVCGYEWPRPRSAFGWRWAEADVAQDEEHFQLGHEESAVRVAALVGRPIGQTFRIRIQAHEPKVVADLCRELDLYLLEAGGPDPWKYAIYHCSTSSNVYSPVHWSYVSSAS